MADEEKQGGSKRSRGVIDRVEDGGTAVVMFGEDEGLKVELPAALLPEGASDGDHLTHHRQARSRVAQGGGGERQGSAREA